MQETPPLPLNSVIVLAVVPCQVGRRSNDVVKEVHHVIRQHICLPENPNTTNLKPVCSQLKTLATPIPTSSGEAMNCGASEQGPAVQWHNFAI